MLKGKHNFNLPESANSESSNSSDSNSTSRIAPSTPAPPAILTSILCADPDILEQLLHHIDKFQLLRSNWISDICNSKSSWTGTFYTGFCATPPVKLEWATAKTHCFGAKGFSAAKQRMARDFLARVLWFVNLELGEESIVKMLPQGQQFMKGLVVVERDGQGAVLARAMYWVMAKMRDVEFLTIDRNNVSVRQAFWFKHLDPVTIVWILTYLRDAIDFEWIMDAAGELDSGTKYSTADKSHAMAVLYMIRIRLVRAAEVALVCMIDAEPRKGMRFLANGIDMATIAKLWKQGVEKFMSEDTRPFLPLENWPVRVGYNTNVVLPETEFFARIKNGLSYV